jgi:hypothetical protein
MHWNADLATARWIDADLAFSAATRVGTVLYLVRSTRLEEADQRTSVEALISNLSNLRDSLVEAAKSAIPGSLVLIE